MAENIIKPTPELRQHVLKQMPLTKRIMLVRNLSNFADKFLPNTFVSRFFKRQLKALLIKNIERSIIRFSEQGANETIIKSLFSKRRALIND